MGSLVRSGIFPGLYAEKSWKNWKYKMTKYKNTNITLQKYKYNPEISQKISHMGSLVRSGIFPGLSRKKSWKNCKYKMTKYKNTNIKTSKVQIQPKNKLENLSYGLSRSKWHLPWAFRNRRIAADILSRSGLHKIRRMRFRNFFDKISGFRAKCFIESIYAFYQCNG